MTDRPPLLGDLTDLLASAEEIAGWIGSALQEPLNSPESTELTTEQAEWFLGEIDANRARLSKAQEFVHADRIVIPANPSGKTATVVGEIKTIVGRLPTAQDGRVQLIGAQIVVAGLDQILERFNFLCMPHSSGGGSDDAVLLAKRMIGEPAEEISQRPAPNDVRHGESRIDASEEKYLIGRLAPRRLRGRMGLEAGRTISRAPA